MGVRVMVQLACDKGGVPSCRAVWPLEGLATDRRQLWRDAKTVGWTRDYDRVLCPQHSPASRRVDQVRRLAGLLPDAHIGQRLGMSRSAVQSLRRRHGIAGLRPGRPSQTGLPTARSADLTTSIP